MMVRFVHILGAIIWVGGQLTVTVVVLPAVYRLLSVTDRADLLRAVGKRFATITFTVFVPLQIGTGVLLAAHHGIGWAALLRPGDGRVLLVKVVLFAAVMGAATLHGLAQARRRPATARAASIAALVGSLGVVLLGAWLAEGGTG